MARFRGLSKCFPNACGIGGSSALRSLAKHAPVAQLDRALDYESRGQEFESLRARHLPNPHQGTVQEHQGIRRCAIARPGSAFSSFDPARHRPLRYGTLSMPCLALDSYTKPVA
jgi:hypothetical protein